MVVDTCGDCKSNGMVGVFGADEGVEPCFRVTYVNIHFGYRSSNTSVFGKYLGIHMLLAVYLSAYSMLISRLYLPHNAE